MSMNQEAFDDIGQVNMQYCWSMFNAVRVECEYWVVLVWFDFVTNDIFLCDIKLQKIIPDYLTSD